MPEFAVPTIFTVKEGLTAAFSKMESGANKFQATVGQAFKNSSQHASLFKQVLGGVTLGNLAAKGIEGFTGFLKDIPEQLSAMAEKGEALGKTAKIIGVNTDELQRFNYSAKMSGISVDGMQASLMKMNNGLAQLKVHQGAIETGLQRIDPQLMMQLRHTTDSKDAFLAVADAVQKTENPQKRAAIAMAVFGKAGQDMIPMLMKGKDGVSALMAETSKYSGIMSKEAIESAEKYADAMKHMQGTMQSLKSAAITPLLTAITPYIDELVEWVNTNRVMLNQDIKGLVTGLTQGIKVAIPIMRDVLWVVKNIGPPVLAGYAAFQLLKGGMMAAAAASKIFAVVNTVLFAFQAVAQGAATKQEALNMIMSANPVALICTAISVAIGLLVLLSSKVGGIGPAFRVVGETFMKFVLTPFNLWLDMVKGALTLLSHIPGLGGLKDASKFVGSAQDTMNKLLTGSTSTLVNSGLAAYTDPYKSARAKVTAKDAGPVSAETVNNHISRISPTFAAPTAVPMKTAAVPPGAPRKPSTPIAEPAKAATVPTTRTGSTAAASRAMSPAASAIRTAPVQTRQAPNASAVALQARSQVNVRVDNSEAPNVTSRVTVQAAPIRDDLTGANP